MKRLSVSHAFHSHLMEPMLAEFAQVVGGLTFGVPSIPMVATAPGDMATPEYWVGQVREPVRFADALSELRERGATHLLEVGPDGVLTALAEDGVPALRRGRPEPDTLLTALARLHVEGVSVDWNPALAGGNRVPLPGYAFDRRRYWPAVRAGSEVDEWRHRVTWTPVAAASDAVLGGTWAVLGPRSDTLVTDVARAVEQHGGTVVDRVEGELTGVVSLLGLAGGEEGPLVNGLVETLDLLREVQAPVWCLTRGAVSINDTDPVNAPDQAQLWGLGRVAALEHPERWGGLVDLPEKLDEGTASLLASVLDGLGEDQLALRAEGLFARRLVPAPVQPATQPWQPSGTVLVTGGTGALGGHVARWLAGRGAQSLVLTSRSGPAAEGAAELVTELQELGTAATVVACDVADRDALAEVIAVHAPTAVVHAAGAPGVGTLAEVEVGTFVDEMRAKVWGARYLDELMPDAEAFVLFSSIAGVWGSGGQSSYGAANAYLDALAEQRRADGRAATSVAWGRWAGSGMAGDEEAAEYLRRRGVRALDQQRALVALGRAIDGGDTCVTVADIDWARFVPAFTTTRPSPLLADLVPPSAPGVDAARAPAPGELSEVRKRLAGLPGAEREALLSSVVREAVATVLGHSDADAVDVRRPFKELGFDSLTAVELRDRLRSETGLELPTSLVFDHPTPAALVRRLLEDLGEVSGAASLLASLDALETEFSATPPDGLTRARMAVRLQTFLSRWADEQPANTPDQTDLDDASDEEMLALIDRELGL